MPTPALELLNLYIGTLYAWGRSSHVYLYSFFSDICSFMTGVYLFSIKIFFVSFRRHTFLSHKLYLPWLVVFLYSRIKVTSVSLQAYIISLQLYGSTLRALHDIMNWYPSHFNPSIMTCQITAFRNAIPWTQVRGHFQFQKYSFRRL